MVLGTSNPNSGNDLDGAIRRLDGIGGRVSWEYLQAAQESGYLSEVALHPDGRVFVVEKRYANNILEISTDLVALNGQTGVPLSARRTRMVDIIVVGGGRVAVSAVSSPRWPIISGALSRQENQSRAHDLLREMDELRSF